MRVGESPEKCIRREIREELNLEINVEQLLPSVTYYYEHDPVKLIPFVCTIAGGEPRLSEHRDMRWMTRRELDSVDLLEADIQLIERLNGCLT